MEHEALPGMDTTREAPRQVFKMAQVAIPDFSITAHEMLQDGDKVAMRATFSGTHQGEFMGFPASGKRVDIAVIDIYQVRDDKIVAHWGLTNMTDVMAPAGQQPARPRLVGEASRPHRSRPGARGLGRSAGPTISAEYGRPGATT